jgi:ankyrin repeat protein
MTEEEILQEQFFEHIQLGRAAGVKEILQAHPDAANWGTKDSGGTRSALHIAAIHAEEEICKILIAAGADIGARDNFGETALGWAALRKPRAQIVKLLLAAGVDPNERLKGGTTPLLRAAEEGSCVATEALVHAGANINAKNDEGSTALHIAAAKGDSGMVRMLVMLGADAFIENNAGQAVGAENSAFRPVVELALVRKREEEDLIRTRMTEGSEGPVAVHKPLKFKANRLSP